MDWKIDRLMMLPEVGVGIIDQSGLMLCIDAESARYLNLWLCRHVAEIEKMARAAAAAEDEKEKEEIR